MLASRKAVKPHGLRSSTAKAVSTSSIAATTPCPPLSPTTYGLLEKRNFSWGAKAKVGSKDAGKVWKGFSTHDHTRSRKQLYRGTFWDHWYASHLRSYPPVQEWRLSSSWGKFGTASPKAAPAPASGTRTNEKSEDDWYCNYQEQKKQQYEDFMKKMENDPIGMLFGRKWANWIDDAEAKLAKASGPSAHREQSSVKSENPVSDPSHTRKPITVETSWEKGRAKQPQRGHSSEQHHERDYVIDPITNRKVPKRPSEPSRPSVTIASPTTIAASKTDISPMPKASPPPVSSVTSPDPNSKQNFEVPVRIFVPTPIKASPIAQTPCENTITKTELGRSQVPPLQPTKSWLAQEGFGLKHVVKADGQSISHNDNNQPNGAKTRIESALDRHIQANDPNKPENSRPALQYDHKEITVEDVDLLRSSDVRASAGLRGKAPKESDVEKQARQRKLEMEHESRRRDHETQLAEEVAPDIPQQELNILREKASKGDQLGSRVLKARSGEHRGTPDEWVNAVSEAETTPAPKLSSSIKQSAADSSITEKANKIKAQIVPLKAKLDAVKADYDALRQQWLAEKRRKEEKAAKKARDMHEDEVNAQKTAMNAMEMRSADDINNGSAAGPQPVSGVEIGGKPVHRQLQSLLPGEGDMASNVHEFASRDRWYKRKAPHASDESDAKCQRLARDKALIQEVRGIYEATYGIIDTDHRQPRQVEEVQKPLSTPNIPISAAFGTHLPPSGSNFPMNACRASSAKISQPWQAFHVSLLGNCPDSDPLAIIQKLFDELRQAQGLIQSHPTSSHHSEALPIVQRLFKELRQIQSTIKNYQTSIKQVSSSDDFAVMLQTVRRACNALKGVNPEWTEKHDASQGSPNITAGDCGSETIGKDVKNIDQQHEDLAQLKSPSSTSYNSPTPTDPKPAAVEASSKGPAAAKAAKAEPAAASPVSNLPSSNGVRREETVFSGRTRGNWQETERRKTTKKQRRAQKQAKRSKLKNVLVTGGVTAALCYAIGVISQMMQH